jgi:hypothetical protein
MTVALHGAGINTALLHAVRCWFGHKHPAHILRAQEFANGLARSPHLLGPGVTLTKDTSLSSACVLDHRAA